MTRIPFLLKLNMAVVLVSLLLVYPEIGLCRTWGLTVDNPWYDLSEIVDALDSFNQHMTPRIVFDSGIAAAEYQPIVAQISQVSAVQGLVVDSFYVKDYSVAAYISRFEEYYAQLKDSVAIWEVGNEVNGEWLGSTPDVIAKIQGAYDIIHNQGGVTALTLYYNGTYNNGVPNENNCWSTAGNQMLFWAEHNIPQALKQGLDYVWVSFYEDDCLNISPDWNLVFNELGALFPNAILGFGEVGTEVASKKEAFINRYYKDMQVNHPRFAGGYFWWYGSQDMIPKSKPLWQVFQNAMDQSAIGIPAAPTNLTIDAKR